MIRKGSIHGISALLSNGYNYYQNRSKKTRWGP
jgi:hypothetical protein